jgi:DNA polymerase-1
MKIILFDGFSILNRAYYALPPLTNSAGEYTNAVFGFMNIFFRFLDEEKPDYIIVAFDLPQPTFRHEMYGAYKGTRKGMPDELRAQVPALKVLLEKMGVTIAACEGYEADDVLGTLAEKAVAGGLTPVIITGDRDMLQLASEEIKIRLPKTKAGKTEVEDYNAAQVFEKYGVTPAAFVDVKALMGDASDNIPGVPGIGEVTATKIIAQYGSLENAIANVDEIKPKKASENLAEFREQAILSRKLAAIALDAPIELELCENQIANIFNEESRAEIERLELKSLYKRFEGAPARVVEISKYEVLKSRSETEEFFSSLEKSGEGAAFFPLWDDENGFLVGAAVANENFLKYIHIGGEITLGVSENEISEADFIPILKKWLESDSEKWLFDVKTEVGKFRRYGITPTNVIFDAMLASYVSDALKPANHIFDEIPTLEEILENKGKRGGSRKTVSSLTEDVAANFAVRSAEKISNARLHIDSKILKNGQYNLLYEIEMPLAFLLAEMEEIGIKVDKPTLIAFGEQMDKQIAVLTALIYDLAGEDFNINSPAQLGEILFGKLGLKGSKKTQKGYSTAADVLEKLEGQHPIVSLVLDYRTHAKLKSTYVDGMLPLIRAKTSRVHSTFQQALTATGRLSSTEPNLQNIPIRTPLGRELRKAFVPADGCVFLDADYSQIELRLLAHMSGDEVLINAFRENEDIHRLTASQVLGISPEEVTPEQRSNAKAVNFGII